MADPSCGALTLSAHSDVVEPNANVRWRVEDDVVYSAGETTLGGDDKGGLAVILEVLDCLRESERPRPDVFVLITPGEETGLLGARHLQWDRIPPKLDPARDLLVLDGAGPLGVIAHSAPAIASLSLTFLGRAAHAGLEPEKGCSAIALMAKTVARFPLGRLGKTACANVGLVQGGGPTNVVPARCELKMEVRSHSMEELTEMLASYRTIAQEVCTEQGGDVLWEQSIPFGPLKPKDGLVFARSVAAQYEALGIPASLAVIGGGSDANVFSDHGFEAVILPLGMYEAHTTRERLDLKEALTTVEAVTSLIWQRGAAKESLL
ncbi:hypothetical protein ABB02_00733 [Clostridiaceae bacterium JG1575]|nr:hypothetical protein ABB02_00733 [Clostridiaceae bacterium JG1575]